MKLIKSITIAFAFAMLISCAETFTENQLQTREGLFASIPDPVSGNDETKALASDFSFSFVDDDEINVYLKSGSNAAMTYYLDPDETDASVAKFKPSSFTLVDGDYVAVYRARCQSASVMTATVSFTGQAQATNASTAHLTEYDYCWATTSVANNSGNFSLNHKVSWLKVSLKATDAANIKSITVSADEGVANTAVIDVTTGEITPSRTSSDVLTLSLGGASGIDVAANGTLTAFITIPSGSYTNLSLSATDAAGHSYGFNRASQITLLEGKYYTLTVKRTDLPEETPFTALSAIGTYSSTNTENPVPVVSYTASTDQMSYGTGSDYRTFKLANLSAGTYAIFTIASSTLAVGETYTVSSDIDGTKSEASFKVVKLTSDCVWLEDKTNHKGYIFAIE